LHPQETKAETLVRPIWDWRRVVARDQPARAKRW